MKSDEDKVYMKIVELEEIYNFVVRHFFCLNKSLGQNHWNNVQIYIKLIDYHFYVEGLRLSPCGNLRLYFL
jgi:hypothetical protein